MERVMATTIKALALWDEAMDKEMETSMSWLRVAGCRVWNLGVSRSWGLTLVLGFCWV